MPKKKQKKKIIAAEHEPLKVGQLGGSETSLTTHQRCFIPQKIEDFVYTETEV
jgi:hypothetical protein